MGGDGEDGRRRPARDRLVYWWSGAVSVWWSRHLSDLDAADFTDARHVNLVPRAACPLGSMCRFLLVRCSGGLVTKRAKSFANLARLESHTSSKEEGELILVSSIPLAAAAARRLT